MKIGVMCAVDTELLPLVRRMEGVEKTTYLLRDFYTGTLDGKEVVAVIGGVGKVNAAITAQALILCYGAEVILFTGAAGALSDQVQIGDVVIGTQVLHHDLEMALMNNDQFPGLPTDHFIPDPRLVELCRGLGDNLRFGRIVSGEIFVTGQNRDGIISRFAPLCVDMESAAVCQVCWFHQLPCLIIRAVSDFANDQAEEAYKENKGDSGLTAIGVTLALIGKL